MDNPRNNNSTKKSKCSNEQVENPSNNRNTCSEEISSLDDLNSDPDANSNLIEQKLKEFLTTTHDPEIDINSTDEFTVSVVHPIIHLIDIAPRIFDNKKPVKVKSRWTRSSQMELVQENSTPLQTKNALPVNNLSQPSEITNVMDVKPVITINRLDVNKSIEITNRNMSINNCNVAVQQTRTSTLPVQVKRKRGRPKKTVIMNNEDISPIVSGIGNQDSVELNSFSHLKPEDSESPKIVKRGRGRPKKNEITSEIVHTPQIVSKIAEPKKRGRKKRISTNVTNSVKNNSSKNESDSEDSKLIQYQPEYTVKITSRNNSSENSKLTPEVFNEAIKEGNFTIYDSTGAIVSPKSYYKVKPTTLYRIDDCIPPFTPLQLGLDDDIREQVTNSSNNEVINDHQDDVFHELNNINWNSIPKKTRSKSISEFSKVIKQRRNSLSDNFTFNSYDGTRIQNESIKFQKRWKSLSYIEGGPNIQMERYQHNELEKKFRTELKRSRSFPNCMLLDTVIWRFLVNEQTNDCDENDVFLSDSDLINELSMNDYNCQYRSKSVPLEQNELKKTSIHLHKSLDNLNALSDNNYDLLTIQEPSDECDLKNYESDSEENEGKIRRSKRLNTKVKDTDMLEEEYLLESVDSQIDYLLKAEQIRHENEKQLSEAQRNDPDLESKLKKLGFTLITNNLFKPSRKEMSEYTQTEAQELRRLKPRRIINTDTYKCHCKYSKTDLNEGRPGCGSECLNRLLNIECGAGCSLKSQCTNKQFQNKQFKRTQIIKTPDKGYGVFALEDIPSGTFVDEYMGEVIDQHEMIKRMKKKLYRNNNYMVQLKHDEIIDATRKGNITRFINHSCEPNCVAEKWNVLGESRMGFFSKNPIAQGEEITFDYSFEIFGDAAQQKCYCGTPKCRGYISKKSRTGDQSSSDESDDNEDSVITKPDERVKKKKLSIKKITNKDKKRLRELDQQLTDISKLKNKNRSDLESSTLNLNKLMVHITDSMSRSHILKFIRENDFNCKRLFMNFNGLSIIHSWMISNNNESLKLEIIQTLSELPISNRNTITKSKVIDIVAEWANIPKNIKEIIENLEYPVSKTEDHEKEVDKLLPHINNISSLVKAARILWKKWIILKMVFKIPKLDRPKEVNISDIVTKPSRVLSQSIPKKPDQYNLIKSTNFCQYGKINHEKPKIKISHVRSLNNQSTPEYTNINSIDNFSKMINHQNQMSNRDKNKAVLEWNKNREYSSVKRNKLNFTIANNSNNVVLNTKHGSISTFQHECMGQEIPTIESCALTNKIKWSNIIEPTPPNIYEVPTDYDVPVSTNDIFETEFNELYPIEEIITSYKWQPPQIDELCDMPTLECILKMAPPCLPDEHMSNFNTSWSFMKPENVSYDARHPSIKEQTDFITIKAPVRNTTEIELHETDSDMNIEVVNENTRQKLFQQCEDNLKNLYDKGLLSHSKSSKNNFIDQSPMKICESFFQKNPSKSNVQLPNKFMSSDLFKCLKIASNNYQEQPSNIIKIHNFQSKKKTMTGKNNAFRIKEKKSVKSDLSSVALQLCNKQLTTTPQNVNLRKKFKNHPIKLNTTNKFATKLFFGFQKLCKKINNENFTLKFSLDTKICILDPLKEIELYKNLIPTVKNILCAELNRSENNDILKVFKQKYSMIYNESKSIINMGLVLKHHQILTTKTIEKNSELPNLLKRKIIWPSQIETKKQKLNNSSMKSICDSKNLVKIKNQIDDDVIFKKPMIPVLDKRNNTRRISTTDPSQGQRISISKLRAKEVEMKQKAGPSNQLIQCATQSKSVSNEMIQEASTSNQSTSGITLSITNANEVRQKPFMKCSPFNKVDSISEIDFEQNVENLAKSFSMDSSIDILVSSESSSEQIESIVETFQTSRKTTGRANLVDDPIVRDYLQRSELKNLESKRKYKLPESMLSLPVEVLNLVPDNQREIKYVVDFYHSMATVIVKVLDLYVKKSCKQGRIKNDEDFKYLAKKLNSNILFKELQVKKVEDLKISDSVKLKVEQYIKKYMLKFGKVYRRKNFD